MSIRCIVAALCATGTPLTALAATVSIGGTALPGQGLVTTVPGATEERFDGPGFPSVVGYQLSNNFVTPGFTPVVGSLAGQYVTPVGNTTGYLVIGNGSRTVSVDVTFSGLNRYIGF